MKKFGTKGERIRLPFHTVATLGERLEWFVNLRWIAVIAVLISVPISGEMFSFRLAYGEIIVIAVLLHSLNLIYFFAVRYFKFKNEYQQLGFAELQIIVDLLIIGFLIHYSGGIGNPFYFLYILHVILSGILFPGKVLPYINAVFAALVVTAWSFAEHFGLVDRINLRPDPIPFTLLITSLAAFYVVIFSGIYILNNFMMGYRALKTVIDNKSSELEKVVKDRSKSFRFAAHELKSPMVAIQSTLEVVKDLYADELKPEVKDMVLKAESRAAQVLGMVKDMLTITQYNLGIEQPVFQTMNFDEWLKEVTDKHLEYALKKNIQLTYRQMKVNLKVKIDADAFSKMADNLISNAIRYTPKGGSVVVRPFLNEDYYGFKVTDTGIGIAEEEIDKIFDEFYRTKKAREIEKIGTGLGLNLVLEIVQKYNGNIYVKSEPGKGSEFMVELPLINGEITSNRTADVLKEVYEFE